MKTADLVLRLRKYKVGAHDGPPLHPSICDEAADEIERWFARAMVMFWKLPDDMTIGELKADLKE